MSAGEITCLIMTGSIALCGLIALVSALIRGEIKKFVIEKMQEAEYLYRDLPKPDKSRMKLEYVIKCVNEQYGISKLFINVKKFVEKIVEIVNGFNKIK